jgi:GNAT superfamily N-acetyltransferase
MMGGTARPALPSAPQPLAERHATNRFDCGVESLNHWLQRRAQANQRGDASRTYVCLDAEEQVVAYYALASSAVAAEAAPGRFRRNMPDPIPVVVLGRLAISRHYQGMGLGRALFQDAAQRALHAADAIGIRGLLVHALSDEARNFYLGLGLEVSPLDPMVLMVRMSDLRTGLA